MNPRYLVDKFIVAWSFFRFVSMASGATIVHRFSSEREGEKG